MNNERPLPLNPLPESVGFSWLEKCLNNLNDMILVTEADYTPGVGYKILWANDVFYKFTGYDPSEVIGKTPHILHGPLTDKSVYDPLKLALSNWEVCRVETLNYKKDGSSFWNEFVVTPIANETGFFTHWISVQRDVTERKRLEETARQNEERYQLAFKGANVGLWDWNVITDEVYYSPIWKSMLGYKEHEIPHLLSEWTRLMHPDDVESSLSKADDFINNRMDKYEFEFRLQHKQGHYVDILSHAFAVRDETGKITRLVGTHVDVTARKQAEQKLNYESTHDKLTGLVNRREFERRAERLLSDKLKDKDEHALCYLDLDQFKVVNDTCGHVAGDELLRQLGSLLQKVIRDRDTLARLGGDEFGVLMEHCSIENALRVASSIQSAIQDYQFIWEGHSFRVSVSIGLVPISNTNNTLTDLLKDADAACYMAKDYGRNRVHVYRIDDVAMSQRHGEMQWVNRIQHALVESRFCLYAQSIEPLDQNRTNHYELLVRMLDQNGDIVPPGAFLPAAERYNIVTHLDRWVIEKAFQILDQNPVFLEMIDFVSINLSGQSLSDTTFLGFVEELFQHYNINGGKICFEITETAAISNLNMAENFILNLKQIGCIFALDDFGSGLSSYGYLKHLPVDFLKIDGIFVKDMIDDKIDRAMVKSINEIGHVMGMKTIAEFVENEQIKSMLVDIGVNYAQGYGIHVPQPVDDILNQFNKAEKNNRNK